MKMLRSLAIVAALFGGAAHAQVNMAPLGPLGGGSGGGGGGTGTVTSVAAGCGVSTGGSAITTTGTVSTPVVPRNNTATTDTITNTDCGTVVTEKNASAVAVAITTAGFVANNYVTLKNLGLGVATYTPSSGLIGGNATLALEQGQSVDVYFDGTNYQTLPGVSVQSNLIATTAPTVSNDNTQGYAVGSTWQNANTGQVWIARSVATGAAVWTNLELSNFPGYIAGNWYLQTGVYTGATGTNPGIGSIRLYPAYIKQRCTLSNLGIRISAGAAGNLQAAIYKNNPATGRPTGTALVSTASMSTAGSASNISSAASVQLEPGLYWWATNTDNATSTIISLIATSLNGSEIIGSATQANVLGGASGNFIGVSTPATFGTWGDLTAATFTEVAAALTIPLVQFQVASVP